MKQYLDERQNQTLGKYAVASFGAMYVVSAIAIVVQLIWGDGRITSVLGETIIMVAGGLVYLYGTIKTGAFTANAILKGKSSVLINCCISMLIATVFTIAYGIMLNKLAMNKNIQTGKIVAFFFVGISILCYVVLAIMGVLSDREMRKADRKYGEEENTSEEKL